MFLDVSLPLYAVLDELVGSDSLAKLRAAAVDSLVQPTVRVNADSLEGGGQANGCNGVMRKQQVAYIRRVEF